MTISFPALQDQHVPFRRSTVASALAGGVKGDVSWLLGDQSWPGKISGPKCVTVANEGCRCLEGLCLSPGVWRCVWGGMWVWGE